MEAKSSVGGSVLHDESMGIAEYKRIERLFARDLRDLPAYLGFEPFALGINETDEPDGSATKIGCLVGDIVEQLLWRAVDDSALSERL
jgi:hypothetical protein